MTSYIKVQRICKLCGTEFTARTTATQYCSGVCSKRAYKARKREEKIDQTNENTLKSKAVKNMEEVKCKEFLSVSDAARLIGCSRQNVYYMINTGQLKATNLLKKKTIIKRSDIDELFKEPPEPPKSKEYDTSECYTVSEAQRIFSVSGKTLYEIIRRHEIPRIQRGRFVYIPKEYIDKIFN